MEFPTSSARLHTTGELFRNRERNNVCIESEYMNSFRRSSESTDGCWDRAQVWVGGEVLSVFAEYFHMLCKVIPKAHGSHQVQTVKLRQRRGKLCGEMKTVYFLG